MTGAGGQRGLAIPRAACVQLTGSVDSKAPEELFHTRVARPAAILRTRLSNKVTGNVVAIPKAPPGGLVNAFTVSTPMLFTVAVVTKATMKVPAASPTTLSLLTKSLVSSDGVLQVLLPAGSRVVSWVVISWPASHSQDASGLEILPAPRYGFHHVLGSVQVVGGSGRARMRSRCRTPFRE